MGYLRIAIALGWVVSLIAVGGWQRHDGGLACQNGWLKEHSDELTKANAKILQLEKDKDKQESDWRTRFAQNDTTLRKEAQNARAKNASLLADIKSGKLVFHDPGAASQCASSGPLPNPPAHPDGSPADVSSGLSGEAAQFLLGEANRADARTRTLNKCINDLAAERSLPKPDTR